MRDHDRLWPPCRPTGEKEQRDLGLSLSRLEAGLDIALWLDEALLDKIAEGDVVVARNGVEEDDAVIADSCLARGLEADLQGVGMEEEDGGLRCLDLIDELLGRVRGVRAAESGRQQAKDRNWVRWTGKRREEDLTYVTMPPTRLAALHARHTTNQRCSSTREARPSAPDYCRIVYREALDDFTQRGV